MKKLLLVGTSVQAKVAVRSTLKKEFEILEAGDGIAGLETLKAHPDIDVVLTALMMPRMGGLEFLQQLKANPQFKHLVVIMSSAQGEESDETTALSLGADDFLYQPFTAEVVLMRIKNVLQNREALLQNRDNTWLHGNILDQSDNGIYVVDAVNYNLYYVNQTAMRFWKTEGTLYSGKKCYEYFRQEHQPCSMCQLLNAHGSGASVEMELPTLKKTLAQRICMTEWLGRPAYIIYIRDITEEKKLKEQAEERYHRELERRLRVDMDFMAYLVFNVARGTVLEHDPHGFPVPTIPSGHPVSEFVDRVLPTVIDAQKRNDFVALMDLKNLKAAYANGETLLSIDYRRYARNEKHIMWARSTLQLMEDPQSKELMCFLYTFDINETRMMQDVITTCVHYDYDIVGYINLLSGRGKVFAKKASSMLPVQLNEEFSYPELMQEFVTSYVLPSEQAGIEQQMSLESIKQGLSENEVYEFQAKLINEENNILTKRIRYASFDRAYGMVLWTGVDVTQMLQREAEQRKELSEALHSAATRNIIKTDYLGSISSEMRLPLKSILSKLRQLEREVELEEIEQLAGIREEANKLIGITNDIMYISDLESGKLKLQQETFLLSDIVQKLSAPYKKRVKAKKQELHIEQKLYNDWVLGDFKTLSHLVENLLDNAVRYTPEGGHITLKLFEIPSKCVGTGYYRIVVQDDGKGIAAERLENIFEPFYVEDNNKLKNKGETSGLGLAIVKGVMDKMGGQVEICSEVGKGTTVTLNLQLPLRKTVVKLEAQADTVHELLGETRLLVVDDNVSTTLVTRRLLEQKGAKVDFVSALPKLLSLLVEEEPPAYDFVLLNMHMAEMDGSTLVKLLRTSKLPQAKTLPLIGIVEKVGDMGIREVLALGLNGCLAKPLKFQQVVSLLQTFSQKQQTQLAKSQKVKYNKS